MIGFFIALSSKYYPITLLSISVSDYLIPLKAQIKNVSNNNLLASVRSIMPKFLSINERGI